MNQIPHTIYAPDRPNPGQVMREAIDRDKRRQERKDAGLSATSHALIFVFIVVGVFVIAIT